MSASAHKHHSSRERASSVFFIACQAALLFISATVYILLHHYWKRAGETFLPPDQMVQLDTFGRATIISAEDVEWYIGTVKSVPLLAQMSERNKNIETRLGIMRQQLQEFAVQVSEPVIQPVRVAAQKGDFAGAVGAAARIHTSLSPGTLGTGERLLSQLGETLRELAELKEAQFDTRKLFIPPAKYVLFWANPAGLVYEVIGWSLFGLFASLLYHAAIHADTDQFDRGKAYIGWTKVFYTPVVAVVLVLAVTQGLLHVGGVESRVWMIPLFGFLAGFNTRKAAAVVDAFSEWTLGRLAQSMQANNDADNTVSPGVAKIAAALPAPKNFSDVAATGKVVLDATLKDEFSKLT